VTPDKPKPVYAERKKVMLHKGKLHCTDRKKVIRNKIKLQCAETKEFEHDKKPE
jgi:hypothetical protein